MMGYKGWRIPEGNVVQVTDASGVVIWKLETSKPVVLEVEKIVSDTYAGETTYTGEEFILLDIYPKTNGTVKVTYGGLTKTITDTSGAEEPNAQQVFFGTFNGVSDSVATPTSGTLTIEGDCYAFGASSYTSSSKSDYNCCCICSVVDFGRVNKIPANGFGSSIKTEVIKFNQTNIEIPPTIESIESYAFSYCDSLVSVTISEGVKKIGSYVFTNCTNLESISLPKSITHIGFYAFIHIKTIKMLGDVPPELGTNIISEKEHTCFYNPTDERCVLEQIIVPKGCGNTYKTATGWNIHADYIVEES